jgi:hypothetical protein
MVHHNQWVFLLAYHDRHVSPAAEAYHTATVQRTCKERPNSIAHSCALHQRRVWLHSAHNARGAGRLIVYTKSICFTRLPNIGGRRQSAQSAQRYRGASNLAERDKHPANKVQRGASQKFVRYNQHSAQGVLSLTHTKNVACRTPTQTHLHS